MTKSRFGGVGGGDVCVCVCVGGGGGDERPLPLPHTLPPHRSFVTGPQSPMPPVQNGTPEHLPH